MPSLCLRYASVVPPFLWIRVIGCCLHIHCIIIMDRWRTHLGHSSLRSWLYRTMAASGSPSSMTSYLWLLVSWYWRYHSLRSASDSMFWSAPLVSQIFIRYAYLPFPDFISALCTYSLYLITNIVLYDGVCHRFSPMVKSWYHLVNAVFVSILLATYPESLTAFLSLFLHFKWYSSCFENILSENRWKIFIDYNCSNWSSSINFICQTFVFFLLQSYYGPTISKYRTSSWSILQQFELFANYL